MKCVVALIESFTNHILGSWLGDELAWFGVIVLTVFILRE